MQCNRCWSHGSWPSKHRPPTPSPPSSFTYLSRSLAGDYRHTQESPQHKPAQQKNERWAWSVQEWSLIIYGYLLHLNYRFECINMIWVGAQQWEPSLYLSLSSCLWHVNQPPSVSPAHCEEDLGGRKLALSLATRTWLRIIALSDALQPSALLCSTALIRLPPWLMSTSPPPEEKVYLYLIVSLPFSPGFFLHFFIYSASTLADAEKSKTIKAVFDILTFCKAEYEHTYLFSEKHAQKELRQRHIYHHVTSPFLLITLFSCWVAADTNCSAVLMVDFSISAGHKTAAALKSAWSLSSLWLAIQ